MEVSYNKGLKILNSCAEAEEILNVFLYLVCGIQWRGNTLREKCSPYVIGFATKGDATTDRRRRRF